MINVDSQVLFAAVASCLGSKHFVFAFLTLRNVLQQLGGALLFLQDKISAFVQSALLYIPCVRLHIMDELSA